MSYFSEREQGEHPREYEHIGEDAWGGFQALIRARIEDRSLGASSRRVLEMIKNVLDVRKGSLTDLSTGPEIGLLSGVKRTSPLATPVNESMT